MGILKLRYPLKNGVFENEQDILTIFNYIYYKLGVKNEEIKEHPIFITEPILNPYNHRKQIASVLFDTLGVPALFFGSQPILSLYATSFRSGIILETGDGITQCCAVYEGFSIPQSFIRYDFGGKNVTEFLQTQLRRSGYNFNTTSEFEIVKKIKETMCYALLSNVGGDDKKIGETGQTQYNLPDGNIVLLKDEKVLGPEILFNPSMIGLENMCKNFIM